MGQTYTVALFLIYLNIEFNQMSCIFTYLSWKSYHCFIKSGLLIFTDSSVGEESTHNAGDPASIPGSGRSTGAGIGYPTPLFLGFPCGSAGKESVCNAGDLGLIPGLGRRFSGEGKRYSLQYSGLENSMDCIINGVAKSQTLLSDSLTHSISPKLFGKQE